MYHVHSFAGSGVTPGVGICCAAAATGIASVATCTSKATIARGRVDRIAGGILAKPPQRLFRSRPRSTYDDAVARRALGVIAVLVMVSCGEASRQAAFPPGDREADYAAIDLSAVPPPAPVAEPGATVAEATVPRIRIYRHADDGRPWLSIRSPGPFGVPPVFLVRSQRDGWLRALLPMEPNGSEGWLRERDVRVSTHDFRVEIDLSDRRLVALRHDRAVLRQAVVVGTSATPTPTGTFFTTVLVRPDDPSGPYGPFAIGLSAYSEALDTFAGGDGQVAIHGTNAPWLIGQAASHGCIRLPNDAIRRLARVLPAGTPVRITR